MGRKIVSIEDAKLFVLLNGAYSRIANRIRNYVKGVSYVRLFRVIEQ